MSAQFARILSPAPAVPAGHGGGETPSAETGGLLAQAAAGPGLWEDLLGELRRAGLIAELLADAFGGAVRGDQAEDPDRRACAHRVPAVDRRGDRRLPGRGEHPGR